MNPVNQIITSKIFWVTALAWFVAQSCKVLFYFYRHHKINFKLFVGSGGMPSSHSALVSCMATTIGLQCGWSSPIFLLAMGVSFVIMADAAGVRRAAGQQAKILNEILDDMNNSKPFPHQRLKEFLGHTPIEVITGALMGFCFAMIFY